MTKPRRWMAILGVVGLLILWVLPFTQAVRGEAMYSYVNEQGTVVVTDDLKKVPERYRKKVKTMEVQDRGEDSTVGRILDSLPVVGQAEAPPVVTEREDSSGGFFDGFTQQQSIILIGGFVGAVLAFAVMTLSRSPALKFAMKWALMLLVAGIVYGLYFSELGLLDSDNERPGGTKTRPAALMERAKDSAKEVEQLGFERTQELDHLTQP